jgi:hypothetical protein
MALSKPRDAVLELGKQLVAELDPDDSRDTLGQWMAHALAEKLVTAKSAPPKRRSVLEAEVAELILRLWAHRADLPSGKRPFEDLEELTRTLRRLNPEDGAFRYFNPAPFRGEPNSRTPADEWLQRAIEIDRAAIGAISYCLSAADELTPGKRETWTDVAEAAGFEDILEVRIVRFVAELKGGRRTAALKDHVKEEWRKGREKAATLKDAATAIEADVDKKMRAARSRKPGARSAD